jgi:hypothetical protein
MNYYRIISLETFIGVLLNKEERYVRPCSWADTFEGYLFSKIYDKNARVEVVKSLYYDVCPRNYRATIDNMLKLEHAKWFVYGQCWSRLEDSDALWRIYSYNNHSIQIQTTENNLKYILENTCNTKYLIGDIKYDVDENTNLLYQQVKQLGDIKSTYEPYLHKRKAFEHEYETRVLIDDIRWYQISGIKGQGASWKIDEKMKTLNDTERIEEINKRLDEYMDIKQIPGKPEDALYVDIPDLSKYICNVRVNPFAEDWYVELVKKLCDEYGINFGGKSKLYASVNDK